MFTRKLFTTVVLSILLTTVISGQQLFHVAHSSITEGQLNVESNPILTIVFDAQLMPDNQNGWPIYTKIPYLHSRLDPILPENDWLEYFEYNQTFDTLSIKLKLNANTTYQLKLWGAKSNPEEKELEFFALTFSTGNSLETGKVSGTISGDLNGNTTYVGLVPADGNFLKQTDSPLFNSARVAVIDENGHYEMNNVTAGEYYIYAMKVNPYAGEENPTADGNGIGFYVNQDLPTAKIVQIETGQMVENVNFPLFEFTISSTSPNRELAYIVAEEWDPTAALVRVEPASGINNKGQSMVWFYTFQTEQFENIYLILTGDKLAYIESENSEYSYSDKIIHDSWLNSNEFADKMIAFLNDKYEIEWTDDMWLRGSLMGAGFEPMVDGPENNLHSFGKKIEFKNPLQTKEEMIASFSGFFPKQTQLLENKMRKMSATSDEDNEIIQVNHAMWIFMYEKETENDWIYVDFIVNGLTGTPMDFYNEISTHEAVVEVTKNMNIWLPEAVLTSVVGHINEHGYGPQWVMRYEVPKKNDPIYVLISHNLPFFVDMGYPFFDFMYPIRSQGAIVEDFIPSDSAMTLFLGQMNQGNDNQQAQNKTSGFHSGLLILKHSGQEFPLDKRLIYQLLVIVEDNELVGVGKMDAVTGEFFNYEPVLFENIWASVNTEIQTIDPNAVGISFSSVSGLQPNGAAISWSFDYISEDRKTAYRIYAAKDLTEVKTIPLPEGFIYHIVPITDEELILPDEIQWSIWMNFDNARLQLVRITMADGKDSLVYAHVSYLRDHMMGMPILYYDAHTGNLLNIENDIVANETEALVFAMIEAHSKLVEPKLLFVYGEDIERNLTTKSWDYGFRDKFDTYFEIEFMGTASSGIFKNMMYSDGYDIVIHLSDMAPWDTSRAFMSTYTNEYVVEHFGEVNNATAILATGGLFEEHRNNPLIHSTTPYWYLMLNTEKLGDITIVVDPATGLIVNVPDQPEKADGFYVSQNYPNPFNPSTMINYHTPNLGLVQIKVYDVLGREVALLVNEIKPAGKYSVEFSGATLPSGLYFYTIKADREQVTKKMMLVK